MCLHMQKVCTVHLTDFPVFIAGRLHSLPSFITCYAWIAPQIQTVLLSDGDNTWTATASATFRRTQEGLQQKSVETA